MKLIALTFLLLSTLSFANGVCIVNAVNQTYLKTLSSEVEVTVENQIGVIKSSQQFLNNSGSDVKIKYAFPLPVGASALSLKWFINGEWNEAIISPQPPDTTLPGGGTPHPNLTEYLGELPLFFNIEDTIHIDSIVIFELTYVQFLEYSFGNVNFLYPNDYQLIQSIPFNSQEFRITLNSDRTIDNFQVLSHTPSQIIHNSNYSFAEVILSEQLADNDYEVLYTLSLDELGLFGFSVLQPDSLVPDSLENGYFVFVAEPDPSANTDVINKVFTLIIDRSGSMSGTKIVQARNAASFIVQNLNEGDKFNIVDFSDNISSFRTNHVEYNQTNQSQALAYISALQANGLTNISGAFDTAVPQFNTANDSTANIIIFLTDGVPTAGISGTEQLVAHINQLVQTTETDLMIFSFGIGLDVNQQLLSLISNSNSGFATFLLNDELESVITNFYLKIRNPVLLNTSISFSAGDITEVYPDPLPNLYKGQQMIVSGRYNTPGVTSVTLQGEAFNQPVIYNYNLNLSDSSRANYIFIPKVWAKQKIEYLLIQYYLLNPNSPEAIEIKNKIIQISIAYGVISPFTSFTGGGTTGIEEEQIIENNILTEFKIIGNYPNPFNPETTIRFSVGKLFDNVVKIKIYNSLGELVRILIVYVNREGIYEVRWDGRNSAGSEVPSDVYIYVVDFGNIILADKMILMK